MKTSLMLIVAATLAAPALANDLKPDVADAFAACVAPDAKVTRLASGMKFIEGPVWLPSGQLVFRSEEHTSELQSH